MNGRLLSLLALVSACQRERPQQAVPSMVSSPGGAAATVSATTPSVSPATSSAPAATTAAKAPACATPESFGAVPLAQFRAADPMEAGAVAAAQRELERVLERPLEYFVTVQTAAERVLVELWHRSAFTPEHCAARGADGRSRTYTYDTRTRRIVATKIW